jgi:hypothetical protein
LDRVFNDLYDGCEGPQPSRAAKDQHWGNLEGARSRSAMEHRWKHFQAIVAYCWRGDSSFFDFSCLGSFFSVLLDSELCRPGCFSSARRSASGRCWGWEDSSFLTGGSSFLGADSSFLTGSSFLAGCSRWLSGREPVSLLLSVAGCSLRCSVAGCSLRCSVAGCSLRCSVPCCSLRGACSVAGARPFDSSAGDGAGLAGGSLCSRCSGARCGVAETAGEGLVSVRGAFSGVGDFVRPASAGEVSGRGGCPAGCCVAVPFWPCGEASGAGGFPAAGCCWLVWAGWFCGFAIAGFAAAGFGGKLAGTGACC